MKWIQGLRLLNGDVQVKMLEDSNLLMYLTPDESLRVRSHSLTGFEWGYGGSGPAQLALALLLAVGVEASRADQLHQAYKWAVVARFAKDGFVISHALILAWVSRRGKDMSPDLEPSPWKVPEPD